MKRFERPLLRAASLGIGVAVTIFPRLLGQTNLRVVRGEVVDDRFSEGMLTGHLHVELGIEGEGRDGIKAARFLELKTPKALVRHTFTLADLKLP